MTVASAATGPEGNAVCLGRQNDHLRLHRRSRIEVEHILTQPLPSLESYSLLLGSIKLMHRSSKEEFLQTRKILDELEGLVPKREHLVAPAAFDPVREKSHFRISGPDNVCSVVLPRLCRQYANGRY